MMKVEVASFFERIVHRVEKRLEEWRGDAVSRKRDVAADRDDLWVEAEERVRLLAEAVAREEAGRGTSEGINDRHRIVFVVASDTFADMLESFSPARTRLVGMVPAPRSGGGTGLRGLWLVFEATNRGEHPVGQ
jgi:hypothetical protein